MAKIEGILSKIYQKEDQETNQQYNMFELAKTGPAKGYNNFISFQNEIAQDDNDAIIENTCNSLNRIQKVN